MISAMIYKDFAIIKRTAGMYALMILFYFGMTIGGVFQGTGMINGFATTFAIALPLSCFALDEQARWEKYAITLPLGRRGVLQAKYVIALLLTVGMGLLIALMNLAIFAFFPSRIDNLPASLLTVVGMMAGCMLMQSLLIPPCMKYGVQKARVILIIIFATTAAVMVPLSMSVFFPMWARVAISGLRQAMLGQIAAVVLAALAAAVLLMFVSYRISLRIYEKKEF
jgi:hypothetical protein